MKRLRLTESDINYIVRKVKRLVREGEEDDIHKGFILQPQYDDFIREACHIIAWKGTNFDLNIGGNEYQAAKHAIDHYHEKRKHAIEHLTNQEDRMSAIRDLRIRMSKDPQLAGVIGSIKEGLDLYKQFKEEGYNFIRKFIGGKDDSFKQKERQTGLALFGDDNTGLSDFYVENGAVFCVRDFKKWVDAGKPDNMEFSGIVNHEDEVFTNKEQKQEAPSELMDEIKDVLNNREYTSSFLANQLKISQKLVTAIRKKINGGGFVRMPLGQLIGQAAQQIEENGTRDVLDILKKGFFKK